MSTRFLPTKSLRFIGCAPRPQADTWKSGAISPTFGALSGPVAAVNWANPETANNNVITGSKYRTLLTDPPFEVPHILRVFLRFFKQTAGPRGIKDPATAKAGECRGSLLRRAPSLF